MIETLEHYAELTRAAMAEAIAGGEPADYLYDLVRDYTARKGKGLRPGLLLAAADACGAHPDGAAGRRRSRAAAHAFLIHDDVEDHSRLRRGRPTLHELHGVALAINAGDALANLAVKPLTSSAFPRYRSREVLAELRMAIRQTTEGQAIELGWRRHAVVDLTPLDYLELVGRKTCWYTTMAPLRIGAQLGRRDPSRPPRPARFLAGCASRFATTCSTSPREGRRGKPPVATSSRETHPDGDPPARRRRSDRPGVGRGLPVTGRGPPHSRRSGSAAADGRRGQPPYAERFAAVLAAAARRPWRSRSPPYRLSPAWTSFAS